MTIIISTVLVLSLLMFVHELGHLIAAKWIGLRVEEFGLGYPPRLIAIAHVGETAYTLNLIPFGAFVRMAEEGEPGTLFADKSAHLRAVFLLSGPVLNLLLSAVIFSICFATGWPVAHDLAVGVQKVLPGSVAQAVGFEDNDLILAVDNHEVSTVLDLIMYARSVNGDIRKVNIRRQGRRLTLSLPPGGPWFVKPESRGVAVRNDAGWVEVISYPWLDAIPMGIKETWLSASSLFLLPIKILRGLIPVDLVRPVGPVGIAQLTGQAARQTVSSGWWFPLLHLTATLSAALAATNLLPLPGLDGGRLLFVAIEALRGKRIDPDRESLIHFLGIVLMLMLILIVTYYDLAAPYSFGGR
ncbi:MAG: M50 family metallopeptidase [Candidatus Hadarchaeum sp.]